MSNVCVDTLKGLANYWNMLDININLSESIGHTAEYLDLKIENTGGALISETSKGGSTDCKTPINEVNT
ncbi:unnamed protein product [Rotaria magnacalcarata]